MNPHQVTRDFERAVADFCGAPHCAAVNSCTMALLLACSWFTRCFNKPLFEIPSRTYVSVPMSIIHAGGRVAFREEPWSGAYQLKPWPIWDSARRFRAGMYEETGGFVCVSFHASKSLGIEQGGAILCRDPDADTYFRRSRFDGRAEGVAPKNDSFPALGWHCYMIPSTAAQGLLRLYSLRRDLPDLPNDDYPDLSKLSIFQQRGAKSVAEAAE